MCSMTSIILCLILLNLLTLVQCAPELPAGDNYGIVATEWAIRDTLNNLFSTLKLKVMQHKLKLKQYSKIHNFFVTITLRDHDHLKKIARLTQVENIDNGTQVFITHLNEVLDEDNKSDVATDSIYVNILIEEFINRLDNLKERNELQNNTKFDLNKAILRYFSNRENALGNTTYLNKEPVKGNDSDDNVLDSIESWQPSGRRIFDGKITNIKRFPFMANVQFFNRFQCGGSIIKSDLIITSASCLQIAYNNRFFRENPAFLSVQVGSSVYERGGENIPVLDVNFHPNYNPKNLRHNLAIMRLTRTLKFSRKGKKIKKINIDRSPFTLAPTTDGIIIVGWGARTLGTNRINLWKNELSFSTLEFYPLVECQEVYTKEFVTDRNFCAGFFSKGGGACNHDAGGPGVSGGILFGVVSFGAPVCGSTDAPTVFTKLGFYTNWIDEIMGKITLQGSQPTTPRTTTYHRFAIPAFTKTTPFRVTPIVSKDDQFNKLRTKDEKHVFKNFLKTMFEKKKHIGHQNKQEEEDEGDQENVQEQEYEQNQEDDQEQEYEVEQEDVQEQEDLLEQEIEQEEEVERQQEVVQEKEVAQEQEDEQEQEIEEKEEEETEEVTESFKPKRKLKRKLKNKITTKWQSQSKENSADDSTTPATKYPTQVFEIKEAKVTSLLDDYDASAPTTSSFKKRNDGNEKTSSSQEKDIDDAIESLIDDLNLNYILESNNKSSPKDQQQKRAKKDKILNQSDLKTVGTNAGREKTRSVVKNKNLNANDEDQSDANDRSDKVNGNEKGDSEEDLGEEQASTNDDINEHNSNNKHVEIATRSQSVNNAGDDSNESPKSEQSEEGHTVTKDHKKIVNDDAEDDDDVNDGGETEEQFESNSIPAEVLDQEHSSNSTERLLEMMEYEDLYKLLMKDTSKEKSMAK